MSISVTISETERPPRNAHRVVLGNFILAYIWQEFDESPGVDAYAIFFSDPANHVSNRAHNCGSFSEAVSHVLHNMPSDCRPYVFVVDALTNSSVRALQILGEVYDA